MDLTQVYAMATGIAIITAALTQVAKVSFGVPKRVIPLIALIIGMLLGVAAAPLSDASVPVLLWAGGISGLMASGMFETAKKLMNGEGKDDKDSDDDK
ncbi:Phage holin [compost metagenome]